MNVGAQVLREKNFKQRLGGQAWSRVLTFYRNCWTVLQCKSVRYVQTPGSTILGLPCPRLLLFGWSAVVIDQKWPARCEDASESRGRGARRSRKAALRCTAVLYFQTKHALSEHLSTNIHPYEGLLMKPDTPSCERAMGEVMVLVFQIHGMGMIRGWASGSQGWDRPSHDDAPEIPTGTPAV